MFKKIMISLFFVILLFTGCSTENDFQKGANAYKKQDYKTALKYFQKACDAGIGSGCWVTGTMYYSGKGVERDEFKVVEFQEKACDAGDARGCFVLGHRYQNGAKVKQSTEKALEYFGKACDMKHPDACENYAEIKKSF